MQGRTVIVTRTTLAQHVLRLAVEPELTVGESTSDRTSLTVTRVTGTFRVRDPVAVVKELAVVLASCQSQDGTASRGAGEQKDKRTKRRH